MKPVGYLVLDIAAATLVGAVVIGLAMMCGWELASGHNTLSTLAIIAVVLVTDHNRRKEFRNIMATTVSDQLEQALQGLSSIAASLEGIHTELQDLRTQIANNAADTLSPSTQAKLDGLLANLSTLKNVASSLLPAPPAPAPVPGAAPTTPEVTPAA